MTKQTLHISDPERARFAANSEITTDSWGNEVLVGLSHDESNRHATHLRPRAGRRTPEEVADARYLDGRHLRAMVFWRIAAVVPDCNNRKMTAEDAFEVGRMAWKAYAGVDQLLHFSEMIGSVPVELRLAALNGWLCAFDDEADRFK
jgi:hypothetical protein